MHRKRSGLIGLAFLLALLIGARPGLAAGHRICIDSGSCHQCDYYDQNYDWLYSIYWCTYN
jgi:hypothetical protein